jgi:tetratricopeptide (TPR) repeat protein
MRHLERFDQHPFDIALAAEAAAAGWEDEQAMELFRRLPQDGGKWEFRANLGLAKRCLALGKVTLAERHLRQCLEICPTHIEANNRLGNLLQAEGRVWESAPHFFVQILQGKCRGDELLGMATVERFFRADDGLEQPSLIASANDRVMLLPVARRALFNNEADEAERLLRMVIEARPEIGEAQGRLGRIIVDRGDLAEFLQWRGSLSAEARRHPEVLFAEGLKARSLGQAAGAVSCFLKALELSPNHLGSHIQIASCLESLGRHEAALEFSMRATLLSDLEQTMNLLRADVDERLMKSAVGVLGRLGRYWEAAGWCLVMTRLEIPQEEPQRLLRHWLGEAQKDEVAVARALLPSRLLNPRDFAEPSWPTAAIAGHEDRLPSQAATVPWKFSEQARELGIEFAYVEGTEEARRLEHIFNVMGGGLGAVDYDLDGWPDIYLAQGNHWRNTDHQPEYVDRLYRNSQGDRFVDVTVPAGVGDPSFSHGVTAGDYDQDGFPDLYIGNKGPNRLYHNNGDGTFVDETRSAGVAGNEWSTSSVFVDLNGDGLPDLYVLNYTILDATVQKECHRPDGQRMACTPDLLPPEVDRCYLNVGNGTFQDVTEVSGMALTDGRGLGVVAWDYAGDGRIGLFVANDTSANFLILNDSTDQFGVPRFREEAGIRGVAFDVDGNAQACMGVAAGDVTGDGRIDLHITNFFGDSNTLYSLRGDGYFDDLTRRHAVRDSSFWMLGFGCQFADFDGDGWDDLIVTNGHVDQFTSRGGPDRMPPQLYWNQRGTRFFDVPSSRLGPFFEGHYLGRGLATLDWNRDGLPDFAVSHIHAPFALVTNQTEPVGRPLVLRLVGRSGCREPTGASAQISIGGGVMTRLLTAGDGFLVTNERRLQFAVPRDRDAMEVIVNWPGGGTQRWEQVPTGCEVVLIEGKEASFPIHHYAQFAGKTAIATAVPAGRP